MGASPAPYYMLCVLVFILSPHLFSRARPFRFCGSPASTSPTASSRNRGSTRPATSNVKAAGDTSKRWIRGLEQEQTERQKNNKRSRQESEKPGQSSKRIRQGSDTLEMYATVGRRYFNFPRHNFYFVRWFWLSGLFPYTVK